MRRCEKTPTCSRWTFKFLSFDLVERDLVVRSIVNLGGARTLVSGHSPGVLKEPPLSKYALMPVARKL
jgi:hypothetical protein